MLCYVSIPVEFSVEMKSRNADLACLFLFALTSVTSAANPDKNCFPTTNIRQIPPSHIFHKLKQPIVVGHRGNILNYQENSIEGMKNLIDIGVPGIHMDARLTSDEQLVVFHDDSTMRMTGEDYSVLNLPYSEIAKMRLQKKVTYSAERQIVYKSNLKIPLLVSALEAVMDRGRLIYLEMKPSNIPPESPKDRYTSLITGQKVAEIIRDMKLEDQVILVSRDPFKLVSALHTHPKLVVDWWFGEEIFSPSVGDGMRQEFVDLPGLRDCYVDTAPLSAEKFAEFVVESGIVSKSVNTSLVDLDFDIFNNATYFSGRTDKTMTLVAPNYNKDTTFGTFDVYKAAIVNFPESYTTKLESLIKDGISRIVTDDVVKTTTVLKQALKISSATAYVSNQFLLVLALNVVVSLVSFISR